ncbi:MAG: mandelate racemase/muconate lactonizing enzyme family protein [Pseudomonadota bacterium]
MTTELKAYSVNVSSKTTWIWFRLLDEHGTEGVGEATLNNRTDQVFSALPEVVSAISKCPFGLNAKLDAAASAAPGVVGRVVRSALEQATLDLDAKVRGFPVYERLGGHFRTEVPCYANINRGTLSRQPNEFADRAELAIEDGYSAVKLAPFDDVTPEASDIDTRCRLIEGGIGRVAAVCDRLGARGGVNVDCHSRLRPQEVGEILGRLAQFGISWFEEPVRETEAVLHDITGIRRHAQELGVTLAGAENAAGLAEFVPFCSARCYDVIMPDIVLAGGPSEVIRIGHLAAAFDQAVSLHNPCGPVMDMHSAHVAAALPQLHSLERQFRESELYDELVDRQHSFSSGGYHMAALPGLGLTVDWSHPAVRCVFEAAIDL